MSTPVEGPPSAADAGVDDRQLISRHVGGDRNAFPELVRRHQDRLWRVAFRTLGDADDAADALQDALLSAYRGAANFRGDAAVTTWLHRIVVNACLDLVRRRSARSTVPLDETSADAGGGPDQLAAWETGSDVLAALRRLPAEQAAAVVLVDIEGFPVADAAAMLEVPIGTVKSRCARARARLAELLAGPAERNRGGGPDVGQPGPPHHQPEEDA